MAGYYISYDDYYPQQHSLDFDSMPYQQDNNDDWCDSSLMKRTHSQNTTYTIDTACTQSSGHYTDPSSVGSPILEDVSCGESPTLWYQTPYAEPQDTNQLVTAAGSQYYPDYNNNSNNTEMDTGQFSHELTLPSGQQAFDMFIPNIEEAAKQATNTAMLITSRPHEEYWVISSDVIDNCLQRRRGQDQNSLCREVVQRLLITHLQQLFSVQTAISEIKNVLVQAAYQLLTRLRGDNIHQICHYAISAALAQLRGHLDNSGATTAATLSSSSSSSTPTLDVAVIGTPTSSSSSSSFSRLQHPEKQSHPCLVPGCKQKGFSRSADLERHYNMVHLDETKKKKFVCDYKKCSRHELPFFRQDHFRDHLRDYHKEDLLRRSKKVDAQWWSNRSSYSTERGWWRCNKCLVVRVQMDVDGFTCPKCGGQCEAERQRLRLRGRG